MVFEALIDALEFIVTERLAATPDQIIRILPVDDWPVAPAIERLGQTRDLRVLLQRPFEGIDLGTVVSTRDAGLATEWRNTVARGFAVVVLGHPTGNLDAGLTELPVVKPAQVVDDWARRVLNSLTRHPDMEKPEAQQLLTALFAEVASSQVSATALAALIDSVTSEPTVDTLTRSLWHIGLASDRRAIDTNRSSVRLRRNREVVAAIEHPFDLTANRRLEAARNDPREEVARSARAALDFVSTGCAKHLAAAELDALQSILFGRDEDGPRQTRSLTIYSALDAFGEYPTEIRGALQRIRKSWYADRSRDSVGAVVRLGNDERKIDVPMRRARNLPAADDSETNGRFGPWTGVDDESSVFHAANDSSEPVALEAPGTRQTQGLEVLRRKLANDVDLDAYLSARAGLREFEVLLGEQDIFPLLLIDQEALERCEQYLEAWRELVNRIAGSRAPRRHALVAQALETVRHAADDPSWVVLGTLHPFRLDPVARLARQVTERLSTGQVPEGYGAAIQWMLDRSQPAYPALHIDKATLHLGKRTGAVAYHRQPTPSTPPLADAVGLSRVLLAIVNYCPWLRYGLSILVVDPPSGPGVAAAIVKLKDELADGAHLAVFHLATHDDVDAMADYPGYVTYLPRADFVSSGEPPPQVDIVLKFAGEPASSHTAADDSWSATRGSHLSLRLTMTDEGDLFDSQPRALISIDPKSGNQTVLGMQQLYAAVTGAEAPLASFRPLLDNSEIEWLKSLASLGDWQVLATPGPLGLVSPASINTYLRFVGRTVSGRYGVYVYSTDDMYSVRQNFERFLRLTPTRSGSAETVSEQLVSRAYQSARSVLFAAGNLRSHIGELIGLNLANKNVDRDAVAITLALDDLGWTRAWLRGRLRPDFLVAQFDLARKTVRLRVVESKTEATAELISIDSARHKWDEGLAQAQTAATALEELFHEQPAIDADLRFSSLIEHIMAGVLEAIQRLPEAQQGQLIDQVNSLARRELLPEIDSYVVLTQNSINRPTEERKVDTRSYIAWAGAAEVAAVLGTSDGMGVSGEFVAADTGSPQIGVGPEYRKADCTDQAIIEVQASGVDTHGDLQDPGVTQPDHVHSRDDPGVALEPDDDQTARRFIAAARIHGLQVDGTDPVFIIRGPSLIAIGIRLEEGATLAPLRSRMVDIARDIGIGDRASEVMFENTAEPRTVQVLLPREDRQYPAMPAHKPEALGTRGYLPVFLGQDIYGVDVGSCVESWPHMLIAGTTGSGKTTFVANLLLQLAAKGTLAAQLVIADGKGDTDYVNLVEPSMFPAAFADVQLGADRALDVMRWAVEQMEGRQRALHDLAREARSSTPQRAVDIFRAAIESGASPGIRPLVVVVDEFADIMLAGRNQADEFLSLTQRIAQVGRSRLVHLVLATQRPDRNTIRGSIKANLDARAVFRLPTQADSMTVLGQAGAERLLPHGDFLFRAGSGGTLRLQGYRR